MKPADVLAPGEVPVAEGRFRGYPPLGRALAVAVLALGIHTAVTLDMVREASSELAHQEVYWGPLFVSVLRWEGEIAPEALERHRDVARRFGANGSGSGASTNAKTGVSTSYSHRVSSFLLPTWLVALLGVVELVRVGWWRRRAWVATAARVVGLDGRDRWIGARPLASPDEAEGRARELLRCRVPQFGAPADVEDVLAPGEKLVWDGRAHGLAPRWRWRLAAAIAFLVLYCALAGWNIYSTANARGVGGSWNTATPSGETTEWKLDWLEFGASHTTTYGKGNTWSGAFSSSTEYAHWKSPVVFLPLFAAIELVVLAWFRSRRYAVTHLRVFGLGWRGRWLGSLSRAQPLEAKVVGNSVIVRGAAGELRLEGLEDPHAVASAFDATGPVPPIAESTKLAEPSEKPRS